MTNKHPSLFSPFMLTEKIKLRNRIVMAPMTTWSANPDGTISEQELEFYKRRSQNVGLVQLSGIKSRKPIYFTAGFLIVLGLIPKFAAIAQLIPVPVLGGAMLIMFGMVAMQGVNMLGTVDYKDNQNLLIVAVSVGMGVGFNSSNLFVSLPSWAQILLSNGIVVSTVSAILLNLVLNSERKSKVNLTSTEFTQ